MEATKNPYFEYGTCILYREVDEFGEVIDVKPVTVVEDTGERVVFWLPIGTPTIKSELLHPSSGGPRRWDLGWKLVRSVWKNSDALVIIQPTQGRAIWVKWSREGEFAGWYVNIQSPLRRTNKGFDIQDFQLDILVAPNRQWQWKDEDELALAVELGRMTATQAKAVQEEGERAVLDIEANRAPYCEHWRHWRPPEELKLPVLPSDWNKPL